MQRRRARPRLVQTQCWCPRDVRRVVVVYFTSSNYFQFSSATAWKLHQHFDVDLCSVCVRYTRALHFRIENLWRIPTVDPRWLNERGEVPERGEAEHTERSRRALLLSEAARLLEQLRRRPAGGSLPHGVQEAQARRRPRARRHRECRALQAATRAPVTAEPSPHVKARPSPAPADPVSHAFRDSRLPLLTPALIALLT